MLFLGGPPLRGAAVGRNLFLGELPLRGAEGGRRLFLGELPLRGAAGRNLFLGACRCAGLLD